MSTAELVVLLDDDGHAIGTAPKATVHGTTTPLHLAFSCYVLAENGQMLLTRRALGKKTWAGVWTNSFCGHPGPGEDIESAVRRRAMQELGVELGAVKLVLQDFRYLAVDAEGTMEHEICPVFVACIDREPTPNREEVIEWVWVEPESLSTSLGNAPFVYSPWLQAQFPLLNAADAFAGGGPKPHLDAVATTLPTGARR